MFRSAAKAVASREPNVSAQPRHEQPKETRPWASFASEDHLPNDFDLAKNVLRGNKEKRRPAETRAWTSFQHTNTENILSEGPADIKNILSEGQANIKNIFSSALREGQLHQDTKDGDHELEEILEYSDRLQPVRAKKYDLSWRILIGTMAGLNEIYARDDFLRDYQRFRTILIFLDSVFRGIAQVMFANSPLSGFIIMIGLFVGNWELALYALLGTCVSTLTAHVLDFNYTSIRAGLYGYNGCLTGIAIACFSFPHSPQMIGPVVIMSTFSTIFAFAVGKIFVQRLELSPFTISFHICTWTWVLAALKFRYFPLNGKLVTPSLLTTLVDEPRLLDISFPAYSVQDNFVGFFNSVAQVYLIENPYSGLIILAGLCVCSRILSFFALFGAVTGQLTAAYLLGLPATQIHAGLWGYNAVLICQALGGMFFVLSGYRIWLFTLYGSVMTVIIHAAISALLAPVGLPGLTFPFAVSCWVFCLVAGSTDLIAVKLTAVSIPEDHYRRYRLSRLVKKQFKFISNLVGLLSEQDDDISWAELAKIEADFIPILMCSYAWRNDLSGLKMLVEENANVHATDHNIRSPLHISACEGNTKLCKWFVDNLKMNVNLVDKFGGTPLFDAFWHGHSDLLPIFYAHGARMPECKVKELAFYLNAFVYENNLEAIKCLLSCGFSPNATDYDSRNALHLAVITNQFNIVLYLVEETSVGLYTSDNFQQTAMQYASRLPDSTIANYLSHKIDNPTPVRTPTEGATLLQSAGRWSTLFEKEEEEPSSMDIEKSLLTALFCRSAAHGDIKKMGSYLEQFPDFNVLEHFDYDLRSAAHVAATEGQLESIRFLSEKCDASDFERMMNREDRWGVSPIDEAYRHGHFRICNFVKEHALAQGERMDRKIPHFPQPEFEKNAVVRLLRKWRKVFLFFTLAASGAAERIDGLFARGYFLRTELYADYDGRTPMHLAAANGRLNVVQVLIRYGYDGKTYTDGSGNCPIDEARRKGFQEIVDELMQLGV